MAPASKTLIVTGGAQGLGKGMVRHFAGLGWSVVFVDRDAEAGNETAAEVNGSRFIHGDVTEIGLPERVVAECLASMGQVNALINNAGVSEFVPIEQLSVEQFRRIIDTNLVAYFAWGESRRKCATCIARRHRQHCVHPGPSIGTPWGSVRRVEGWGSRAHSRFSYLARPRHPGQLD